MQYHLLPETTSGYRLMQNGARALSIIESNGIRVDVKYLNRAIKKSNIKIKSMIDDLLNHSIMREWKKRYGPTTNLQSREQLGKILVDTVGLELDQTKTGRAKTDFATLSKINHPFVNKYLRIEKLKKAVSTFLRGIQTEQINGRLHPFFNLHTVLTYRSSSDTPNFQNFPNVDRDHEIGTLVRRAFVPSPGCILMEADYGGLEVCISACYNKDTNLISYIKDSSKDMHRDMACDCFLLPIKEVTHAIRYHAKNKFVFPQFYGDWFVACAKNLWEAAVIGKEKTESGRLVKRVLKDNGITRLGELDAREIQSGTFVDHIKGVEQDFWENRFPEYAAWKLRWYEHYQKKGYVKLLSGFTIRGVYKRNEIINSPIQGSGFHCLLWSLIRLQLVEFPLYKLKTKIVGQIHDSIILEIPIPEIKTIKTLLEEVMIEKLMKRWKWIIVPLKVEFETYSKSWAEKDKA